MQKNTTNNPLGIGEEDLIFEKLLEASITHKTKSRNTIMPLAWRAGGGRRILYFSISTTSQAHACSYPINHQWMT